MNEAEHEAFLQQLGTTAGESVFTSIQTEQI